MLKLAAFLSFVILVTGLSSPNGKTYLSLLSPSELEAIPDDVREDAILDVPGLLNKYGYPAEVHNVKTEDGYIVTLHRLTRDLSSRNIEDRIPVLLMHDLMGSSADWILNGPGKSLAYILADEGYDVWLGNARGSYYSQNHASRKSEGRKFWMFSWHQIGYYDLPAMIDHILKKSNKSKLHYIGHSQGATTFFVMGSTRPVYNDKIISMQALSPVAYMSNMKNPLIKAIADYGHSVKELLKAIGTNSFMSKSEFAAKITHEECYVKTKYLNSLDHINDTLIPLYMSHAPAGASSRQYIHYAQNYQSGKFRNYDYGTFGNLAVYESSSPSDYNLKKITAPVALHFGDSDDMSDEVDVIQLHKDLDNPIGMFEAANFNHLSFIWAIDARSLLYDRVLKIMKSFE